MREHNGDARRIQYWVSDRHNAVPLFYNNRAYSSVDLLLKSAEHFVLECRDKRYAQNPILYEIRLYRIVSNLFEVMSR
jgi:hypothetical protein